MDVFANILEVTRLTGHAARAEFRAPWGLRVAARPEAAFVHVTRGSCELRMRGGKDVLRLNQGDVVLVPHGVGHELGDAVDSPVADFAELMRTKAGPDGSLRHGGQGEPCAVVWGAYCFEAHAGNPFLEVLPAHVLCRADEVALDHSLGTTLQLLVAEVVGSRPGAAVVSRLLVDVLFVQLVRHWAERQPEGRVGWLFALRDERVRRALSRMHERPQHGWTVESLAREASMSRAAFARRFQELLGEGPHGYLTTWRMRLAAQLLRSTALSVAEVATRVGYESEFSFSRAFRRAWDEAPARYRNLGAGRPSPQRAPSARRAVSHAAPSRRN